MTGAESGSAFSMMGASVPGSGHDGVHLLPHVVGRFLHVALEHEGGEDPHGLVSWSAARRGRRWC
jgi:hypothetical protein